ncbi:MAG: GNAT family N-acetyltransferase [Ruminiclostridium sp.]|nr:GNAT family N-acetyltransferase [Ruminiclostridium sp.]
MGCSDIQYINSISVTDYKHLCKSVGWKELATKQAQTGISNSSYIVSAVNGDKTVGMARVVSDGGYVAIIVDVVVLPEFQGKGIGKTMMNMVMEHISSSIAEGEGVSVILMAAKNKESFYKQFGFSERPDEKFGPGMTQWISK